MSSELEHRLAFLQAELRRVRAALTDDVESEVEQLRERLERANHERVRLERALTPLRAALQRRSKQ